MSYADGIPTVYLPLNYYDIHLNPNASIVVNTDNARSVMVFTLLACLLIHGILQAIRTPMTQMTKYKCYN